MCSGTLRTAQTTRTAQTLRTAQADWKADSPLTLLSALALFSVSFSRICAGALWRGVATLVTLAGCWRGATARCLAGAPRQNPAHVSPAGNYACGERRRRFAPIHRATPLCAWAAGAASTNGVGPRAAACSLVTVRHWSLRPTGCCVSSRCSSRWGTWHSAALVHRAAASVASVVASF